MQSSEAATLLRGIRATEGRDIQLWSIALLMVVVLAAGLVALLSPNLFTEQQLVLVEARYLAPLLFGFVALILLFNVYALDRRRQLRVARATLIEQLARVQDAEHLALLDPLTGLFNRRYMDQALTREIQRVEGGTCFSLLMIDINDFRGINNRHGHLEGDRVLCEVAALLRRTFHASDVLIRFGGDEFLVLLPDTSEAGAERGRDRLLQALDERPLSSPAHGYARPLSCGVACYCKGDQILEILRRADELMYEHKSSLRLGSVPVGGPPAR